MTLLASGLFESQWVFIYLLHCITPVYVEPTPRGPLKRRAQNKNAENKIPPTSVNGSGDDDENGNKK